LGKRSAYPAEHKSLSAILAQREYGTATKTSLRERVLEWLGNLVDRIFGSLVGIGTRAPWIAIVLRAAFLVAVCIALAWLLIRIERRTRLRLVADSNSVGIAPSAREWQLWLADAKNMAEKEAWREAIHFLYWAVIARLESRNVWATDRARTPREYLRLIPNNDTRREHLAKLTRSFERTWYGARPAASQDYESAAQAAEELGVR